LGYVFFALGFVAEIIKRTDPQGVVCCDSPGLRAIYSRDFLTHNRGGEIIHPLAAVFFWDDDAEQSQLAHTARQRLGKFLLFVELARYRGDFGFGESAHRIAQQLIRLGQCEAPAFFYRIVTACIGFAF
jgi:hypothetical protein